MERTERIELPERVVLVVDDDPSVRYGLARALARYFRVICAEDFEAAVWVLESESVAVLVTDHEFAAAWEPTGLDLLRFTRWVYPRVRRVVISARPPSRAAELADLILPKPWPEQLPEVLRWLITAPRVS